MSVMRRNESGRRVTKFPSRKQDRHCFHRKPHPAWAGFFVFTTIMNKKNIFYGVFLTILVVAVIFIKNYQIPPPKPTPATSFLPVSTSTTPTKSVSDENKIRISIIAGDESYTEDVPSGSTVYDAMNILAKTTIFSFKSVSYPGLGYFVEEINGEKNQNGAYWTLYVNGKYSPVGASSYKLTTGDSVEWRYEKD